MLTIKLNNAGSLLICQSPEVSIGLAGSALYQSVMDMTGQAGQLDAVQMFPETFNEYGEQLGDELTINIPRDGVTGLPIAVLITDVPGHNPVECTGTNYQFIWAGDVAEVLNENGITLHVIK